MPAPFQAFSPSHNTVLTLCVLAIIALALMRRFSKSAAILSERVLGSILLLLWPVTTLVHWRMGSLTLENGLPFHFCDVAGIAGGIALWTRRQLACEIVYFFGLAGTLQGLLTPNLKFDFPDPRFLVFFLLHGGVVIAAIHVVTSMKHAPRPGAVPRLVAVTLIYAALIGLVNFFLQTNYAFLCHKPEQASLMDSLGPWPWYIASLVGLCAVFYTILNLPFALNRLRSRKVST